MDQSKGFQLIRVAIPGGRKPFEVTLHAYTGGAAIGVVKYWDKIPMFHPKEDTAFSQGLLEELSLLLRIAR